MPVPNNQAESTAGGRCIGYAHCIVSQRSCAQKQRQGKGVLGNVFIYGIDMFASWVQCTNFALCLCML